MARLKEYLRDVLSVEELALFTGSYDIIGDIAVLEIDPGLRHKEKEIAGRVLSLFPHVHVVVRKDSAHEGAFRLQQYVYLAGEERFVTEHKENGLRLRLDISSVYFSPRTGHERLRVASLVQPHERVLVLFAGCGPFALLIAKQCRDVVAVEMNPVACAFMRENVLLNKLRNMTVVCDDAHTVVLDGTFDRIVMPLPSDSVHFLDIVKKYSHVGTVVHFYTFVGQCQEFKTNEDVVHVLADAFGSVAIKDIVVCGDIAIRASRVCFNFMLTKAF